MSNYEAMIAALAITQPKPRFDDRCDFYNRRGEIVSANIDRAWDKLEARSFVGDPAALHALPFWYRS